MKKHAIVAQNCFLWLFTIINSADQAFFASVLGQNFRQFCLSLIFDEFDDHG